MKGIVQEPRGYYEAIAKAIRSLEAGVTFSPAEIRRLVPHVSLASVQQFICEKLKSGWLDRVAWARYRRGGIAIKTTLPNGLVAEAVWTVLYVYRDDRKSMRLPEIVGEAESYLGRPETSTYRTVSGILGRWTRAGHLHRSGERGEYAYLLKEGVIDRPILRD